MHTKKIIIVLVYRRDFVHIIKVYVETLAKFSFYHSS